MYEDIDPQAIRYLLIAVGIVFAIVVYVVWRDRTVLSKSHEDLDKRVLKLRLGDMIARLNIPFEKYDRKTSDLDKERHIWACEHCPHPDKCERMLNGEDLNPGNFCPNYRELEKLK